MVVIAILDKNKWDVDAQNVFRIRRPDKSTLIILDHQGNEALNIIYLNARAFTFTCSMKYPDGYDLSVTKTNLRTGNGEMRNVGFHGKFSKSMIMVKQTA
jgi:hypothetical protein